MHIAGLGDLLQLATYERRLQFLDALLDLDPTLELDAQTVDTAVVLTERLQRDGRMVADADF